MVSHGGGGNSDRETGTVDCPVSSEWVLESLQTQLADTRGPSVCAKDTPYGVLF